MGHSELAVKTVKMVGDGEAMVTCDRLASYPGAVLIRWVSLRYRYCDTLMQQYEPLSSAIFFLFWDGNKLDVYLQHFDEVFQDMRHANIFAVVLSVWYVC